MGKLVLYFPDGSTRDILLSKERITIGRRPDNDVSLPAASVSAEHAAVVTVLDDSFLEDLGSTNGTFVNDRPVTKHFLRDRDRVDIGREILVYYSDDDAAPEVLPPDLLNHDAGNVLAPLDAHLAALADLTKGRPRRAGGGPTEPRPVVAEFDPQSSGPMTGQVATEFDSPAPGASDEDTTQRVRVHPALSPEAPAAGTLAAASAGAGADGAAAQRVTPATAPAAGPAPAPASAPGWVVRVADGPDAGREIALDKEETLLGRIGVEVVALRRNAAGVDLVALDGDGAEPAADSTKNRRLQVGDTFTAAGVVLELSCRPPAPH